MKRSVAGALVVLAAVLAPSAAAQVPTQDSVIGSGSSPLPGCNGAVEIGAQSGPSGENPTGQVSCGTLFSGPVTCLRVSGNVALLTVQSPVFGAVGVRVTDLGSTDDRLEALPGTGCPTPLGAYSNLSFTGSIVVHDAPPFPSPKQQCKNGGWRTFGVFRNQGDCVSFVATGGKNQPANSP
jgi:hypothetical protein